MHLKDLKKRYVQNQVHQRAKHIPFSLESAIALLRGIGEGKREGEMEQSGQLQVKQNYFLLYLSAQ